MAPLGKIIIVTVGMEDIVVPLFSFLSKEPSIIGSCSATPKEVVSVLHPYLFTYLVRSLMYRRTLTDSHCRTRCWSLQHSTKSSQSCRHLQ